MNKTAIKNFAMWARNKLIADISNRAGLMGITADGIQKALPQSTGTTEFYDIGTTEPYSISGDAVKQRNHLVELIRRKEKETNYKTAYKYVLEEVAYTWFNRLIAVRFMEVNDYLPSHIRVLSSDSGKIEPDLVTTPFDAELAFSRDEEQTIYQLKQENKIDEVFRILFIKQCNALNEILPALFEKTSDYTEVLLNLSVIDQDGVVYHLVHDIPEEDFDVERGGQVEIIGWLYQYYNTEPKKEAFAKSGKISKEEIPAVTQLFTPDWIVRYMVENSVGRLWIEHLRALDESADEAALASGFGWKYYLPEAEQEPEVEAKRHELRKKRASLTPEQITMIDPCMGSGHILVYAFDVLMQIYENAGYGQRDAAMSILENNLFGLDIDERAYQMAYFAVMMKAREYNRRILNGQNNCKVYAIQESNGISDAALSEMGASLSEEDHKKALVEVKSLIAEFKDAKEYGSILMIKKRDWSLLRRFAVPNVGFGQLALDINGVEIAAGIIQTLIDTAEVMAGKYLVTSTNPPYMAISNGDGYLNKYVKENYSDSKADLYAVFIEKCSQLTVDKGFLSMITQHGWMFLSSFEKLRRNVLCQKNITNMVHLGARAFEEIGGEVVQTVSFVLLNTRLRKTQSVFCRLVSPTTQEGKESMFLKGEHRFTAIQDNFNKIPGSPVAYWVSDKVYKSFDGKKVENYAEPKSGMTTTDNSRFLRLWFEPDYTNIGFGYKDIEDTVDGKYKWFPFCKGGDFRRWAGNESFVVNWYNNGAAIREAAKGATGGRLVNVDIALKKCLVWTKISSSAVTFRYKRTGVFFSDAAPGVFSNDDYLIYLLGLLNTKYAQTILELINPTLNYVPGAVASIPVIDITYKKETVERLVTDNISISVDDWNDNETSWDFRKHPLVRGRTKDGKLSSSFAERVEQTKNRFEKLKQNEETLNEIFIEQYQLSDELSYQLDESDISIKIANYKVDIRSLLSYAVGCMFGRYSLDQEGVIYAGGDWDTSKYDSFVPDADNVIPITDEEYLEDDVVSRLCTWLKVVYGESTLEENLDYIAKALGGKGSSSREIIRVYFLNEFFNDHCQNYSVTGSGKRPIYWLFDSGKQNGFKALIYLHRYNADTIGNLRIDYLHRMQRIYESEISRMQDMIDHSTSVREVAQATKRREKLQKQLKECREYDEKLAHLVLSRISLDLDDGVKINYRKIQTASDGKYYEVLADAKNIMANDKLWKQYKEGKW